MEPRPGARGAPDRDAALERTKRPPLRAALGSLALLGPLSTAGCQTPALQETVPESEPPPPPSDALRLVSADGRHEVALEGLFQVTAAVFERGRDPRSDFALRRMRPELHGRLADALLFRLEPNFTEGEVELEEAWIGPELWGGNATLMLGRMKAPFGLEEVRSRRHIDFPRFSLLNQFSPAEDHGAFLYGKSPSGVLEYGLAVYNGTGEGDTNGGKDAAGRLMVHPWAESPDSVWHALQLGVAATTGDQDEDLEDETIDNEAGQEVLRFAPGARLDGARHRLGLELAWFHGPWFLQSEALWLEEELSSTAGDASATIRGAYLTLSRALTGEAKSFRGVRPDVPFDVRTGRGRGAFVLALRAAGLALDDELDSAGLTVPGTFTDRIHSLSLGLDWIPNQNAILRTAYVASFYDDRIALDSGSTDREGALLIEFQLHF